MTSKDSGRRAPGSIQLRHAILTLALALITLPVVAQPLPHPIDVFDIGVGPVPGVRLVGENDGDRFGMSSRGAGDVNGDGFEDVIVAAIRTGQNSDVAYLFYGGPGGLGMGGLLNASSLSGQNGIRFVDDLDLPIDQQNKAASGLGDVNGDGFADVLVQISAGTVELPNDRNYLIFGSSAGPGTNGLFHLSDLNGVTGTLFLIEQGAFGTGRAVSGAGDVNGDGLGDWMASTLALGATGDGRTYLIYGTDANLGGVVDLVNSPPDGTDGALIDGVNVGDQAGAAVSGAGDVDGDGFDDLLIGALEADPNGLGGPNFAGAVYLLYGSAAGVGIGGQLDLSTLDGASGVRLDGASAGDRAGMSVAGAGDTDGDGLADFLVGATGVSFGSSTGATYLFHGTTSEIGSAGVFDLAGFSSIDGVTFQGDVTDKLGAATGGAGDIDGDGLSDLMMSAPAGSGNPIFVVYGSDSGIGVGNVLAASAVDGANGVRFFGPHPETGGTTSTAGDVNGDGLSDFLIGAAPIDSAVLDPGRVYLTYGSAAPFAAGATHCALTRPGDAPRTGVGMLGDGSHSIPLSRVWVDYDGGDNGTGGASSTEVVFHRAPVSDFSPLEVDPTFEWEVSTARVGFTGADVTFKGLGVAGETDWQAVLLVFDTGTSQWFAPPSQVRDSLLHEITLPAQTFATQPLRAALVTGADPAPPRVLIAVFNDENDDGTAGAGETLSLVFDRGVILSAPLIEADLDLPVGGDTLGTGAAGVANAFNSRIVDFTLGTGVSLTVPGVFGVGAASGADIAPGLPPTLIRSLVGVPAEPRVSGPADVVFSLVGETQVVGAGGGAIEAQPSPDALYDEHRLTVPAGALPGNTSLTIRPPVDNAGLLSAIQITPNTTFTTPATLRLEYLDSDIDTERGQIEGLVRPVQLVDVGGTLEPMALPGTVTVDTSANTVTVDVGDLNPLGSPGTPGLFATLPIQPIVLRTISIAPSSTGGTVRLGVTGAVLAAPVSSFYAQHAVEIPGWEPTADTDPNRIDLTIGPATLAERISTVGGQSFPAASGALFAVTAVSATGERVAFPDPVNIDVQFFDGTGGTPDDVVALTGFGNFANSQMRLAHDAIDGDPVDWRFDSGVAQTVTPTSDGGVVEATGVANLTGASGRGVWGTAVPIIIDSSPAGTWALYR